MKLGKQRRRHFEKEQKGLGTTANLWIRVKISVTSRAHEQTFDQFSLHKRFYMKFGKINISF